MCDQVLTALNTHVSYSLSLCKTLQFVRVHNSNTLSACRQLQLEAKERQSKFVSLQRGFKVNEDRVRTQLAAAEVSAGGSLLDSRPHARAASQNCGLTLQSESGESHKFVVVGPKQGCLAQSKGCLAEHTVQGCAWQSIQ